MKHEKELIEEVLRLVREMIILSDEGHAAAEDDGCRLLYSILQDCAYRIKMEAEQARKRSTD
ncbi:MAG: hypothetical protein KAJ60_06165 [Desulfobulbaceae bacterium]|nr:hypothetical protein [Desulfobulbaceae bacterium]